MALSTRLSLFVLATAAVAQQVVNFDDPTANGACTVGVFGCAWCALLGPEACDAKTECDACGIAYALAYDAGAAIHDILNHFHPGPGSSMLSEVHAVACPVSVAGCGWAGIVGPDAVDPHTCDCGIMQALAYKVGSAIRKLLQTADSNRAAMSNLTASKDCTTTVAGCTWAGSMCLDIGHACDCGMAQAAAYKAALALHKALWNNSTACDPSLPSTVSGSCSMTTAECVSAGLLGRTDGSTCECGVDESASYTLGLKLRNVLHPAEAAHSVVV